MRLLYTALAIAALLHIAVLTVVAYGTPDCSVLYNGTHLCIPSVTELFNVTYRGYTYLLYWVNSTCVYISVYSEYGPGQGTFSLYGVLDNSSLVYLTTINVTGEDYYCNSSLDKYNAVVFMVKTTQGEVFGPLMVLKPTLVPFPALPSELRVWVPLIALGFLLYIAIYFNMRKLLAGLVAFTGFSIFFSLLFLNNPLLAGLLPAAGALIAALVWYILQKFPEGGE